VVPQPFFDRTTACMRGKNHGVPIIISIIQS
jgi:hypothetical protein